MPETLTKEVEFKSAVIALYDRAEELLGGYPRAPFEVSATGDKPAIPMSIAIDEEVTPETQQLQARKSVIQIRAGRITYRVKSGAEVVPQIALISKVHGLKLPHIIGLSTDHAQNEKVRSVSPNSYVGSFYDDGPKIFDALRERLHS